MEYTDSTTSNTINDRREQDWRMRGKMQNAFEQLFATGTPPSITSAADARRYGGIVARKFSELNQDQTKWNRMSFWEKLKPSSWYYAGDKFHGFERRDMDNASEMFDQLFDELKLPVADKDNYRREFMKGFVFSDMDTTQDNAARRDAADYIAQQASEAGTAIINPAVRTLTGGKANTWAEFVSADGLDMDTVRTSGDLLKSYADVRGTSEAAKLAGIGAGVYTTAHVLANAWTFPYALGWTTAGDAVNHAGRTIQDIYNLQKNPNKWVGPVGQGMELVGNLMAYKGAVGTGVKILPKAFQKPISRIMYAAPVAYYTLKDLGTAGWQWMTNSVDAFAGPKNAGGMDQATDKYVAKHTAGIDFNNTEHRAQIAQQLGIDPDDPQLETLHKQKLERGFGRNRTDAALAHATSEMLTFSGVNADGSPSDISGDADVINQQIMQMRVDKMPHDTRVDALMSHMLEIRRQSTSGGLTPEAEQALKNEFLEKYYETTRLSVSRGGFVDPDIFRSRHFTDDQVKTLLKTHIQAEHARVSPSNDFIDAGAQAMAHLGGIDSRTDLVVQTMNKSEALKDSVAAYTERTILAGMKREDKEEGSSSLYDSDEVKISSVWNALGAERRKKVTNNVVAASTGADIVRLASDPEIKGKTGDLGTIANDIASAVAHRCNSDGKFAGELVMAFMPKLKELGGAQSNEQLITFLSALDPDAIANNMSLEELKKLAPVIAQLASEGADDSELPEELKKLKDGMTEALQTRLKNEMTKNPFEVMPIATSLYLASKGHPKLAEFFSDPFKFYGTALLVLVGGSWLLSELFSDDDEKDDDDGDRSIDKQKDLMEELLRQRGLQAHDNGANYELNL